MELSIQGHNIEITTRLRNYVEKKTARLDRYMPNLNTVKVELTTENTRSAVERQVAQITIRDDRGTILRAEERNSDIFAAIEATDTLKSWVVLAIIIKVEININARINAGSTQDMSGLSSRITLRSPT